jgi:hypothetical protein
MHIRPRRRARQRESGSALIEFVLCCSFFWLPLFLGLVTVGQNLVRAMQVTQVCRDAAHMFAYGVDFSQATYQNLLVGLAPSLGLTTSSGGHGVVIFSQITYIDSTCSGTNRSCSNSGYYVVTRRVTVGNSTIKSSLFGTPNASLMDSTGTVTQNGYLNDASTRAAASGASFASPITLPAGQYAYAAELYVTSPQPTGWSTTGPPSVSARFIF